MNDRALARARALPAQPPGGGIGRGAEPPSEAWRRGFTLLELVIALAIAGALLAILLGSLRVGLAAWRQGDERAEVHQHLRSLSEILANAVGAAFPYRQSPPEGGDPQIQFKGESDRLSFVTFAPPFPLAAPIPFTAVDFSRVGVERPGLAIRQKALPNFKPFDDETDPVFVDLTVTEMQFHYLSGDGSWTESWQGAAEKSLPKAVEIRLTAMLGGRPETLPPLTISIPARTP